MSLKIELPNGTKIEGEAEEVAKVLLILQTTSTPSEKEPKSVRPPKLPPQPRTKSTPKAPLKLKKGTVKTSSDAIDLLISEGFFNRKKYSIPQIREALKQRSLFFEGRQIFPVLLRLMKNGTFSRELTKSGEKLYGKAKK